MAVGWFIAKFQVTEVTYPVLVANRYCLRIDSIDSSGLLPRDPLGNPLFGRIELTDRVLYKIPGSAQQLSAIAALPDVKRIPSSFLDDPLSSLTANQRSALVDELQDQGYTLQQINGQFPNIANATLRQVLKYMARTRRRPVFNTITLQVEAGAEEVACYPGVDVVEAAVQ